MGRKVDLAKYRRIARELVRLLPGQKLSAASGKFSRWRRKLMVKRYSHLSDQHTGEVVERMTQKYFKA